jgi:hypothetical protein
MFCLAKLVLLIIRSSKSVIYSSVLTQAFVRFISNVLSHTVPIFYPFCHDCRKWSLDKMLYDVDIYTNGVNLGKEIWTNL